MLRGMVFVDHMNFNIAVGALYSALGLPAPKLDYNTIFRGVVERIAGVNYIKTTIFAPTPDNFLMNDPYLHGYSKWVHGMKNAKYLFSHHILTKPTTSQ